MTRYLTAAAALAVAVSATGAGRTKPPAGPTPKKAAAAAPAKQAAVPADARAFLKANCVACHNAQVTQGGLDLAELLSGSGLSDPKAFARWVSVHDRVRDGEMPPKGSTPRPAVAATDRFLKSLAAPMVAADDARARREGRAAWRRMNRNEYENALRDLLDAPWLPIRDMLPEDGVAHGFNKVGDALDVSHVQMGRYLAAAEYALRERLAQEADRPATTTRRYYTREEPSFFRPVAFGPFNGSPERATFPILGCASADTDVLDQKVWAARRRV